MLYEFLTASTKPKPIEFKVRGLKWDFRRIAYVIESYSLFLVRLGQSSRSDLRWSIHACSVNGIWSCRRSTHKEIHVFYKNVEHIELDAKFLSHVSFKFRDLEAMERLFKEGRGVHIDVGMLKPGVFLDHSTRGDRLLRRVYKHTLILPRLMQSRSKCRDVSNHIDEPSHPRLLYQRPLS